MGEDKQLLAILTHINIFLLRSAPILFYSIRSEEFSDFTSRCFQLLYSNIQCLADSKCHCTVCNQCNFPKNYSMRTELCQVISKQNTKKPVSIVLQSRRPLAHRADDLILVRYVSHRTRRNICDSDPPHQNLRVAHLRRDGSYGQKSETSRARRWKRRDELVGVPNLRAIFLLMLLKCRRARKSN